MKDTNASANLSLPMQGGLEGLFFELLQVAIGNRKTLTRPLTDDEWASMYGICEKHALLGIAFAGVEKLPKEQTPPFDVLAEWVHDAQVTKDGNELLTSCCLKVSEQFNKAGFCCCVLKGQGNQNNYPENLRYCRTPGDIDIWVKRRKNQSDKPKKIVWGSRKDTVAYVKQRLRSSGKSDQVEVVYHHIDMGEVDGVPVEVHFTPSWAYNPLFNRRIQKWYDDEFEKQCNNIGIGGFPSPTVSFNVIYQLMHIYRHLFIEGIGLRQLLDYYFVLRKFRDERLEVRRPPQSPCVGGKVSVEGLEVSGERIGSLSTGEGGGRGRVMNIIEHLGMKKFAGAVMWVQEEVFDMPAAYMLCPPNEKEGRHMLNEIMIAGNFGTYDNRIKASSADSRIGSLMRRHAQTSRFFFSYPEEAICELPFRGWQYLWKLWNSYQ